MFGRRHDICQGTSGLPAWKREFYIADWLNQPPPVREEIKSAGPGTELKKLLAWLRIKPEGCACNAHALEMDSHGPAWCREHLETIVGWLAEAARERQLRFSPFAARQIVKLAIRRAEKAAGI